MVRNSGVAASHRSRAHAADRIWQDELQRVLLLIQERLDALGERVDALEAAFSQLGRIPNAAEDVTHTWKDSESATREALHHLHDVPRLGSCRLTCRLAQDTGQTISGSSLQSALNRAIEELNPATSNPPLTAEPSYYDILHLTFQEGLAADEVARHLSISRRQYFRQLKLAIDAVAMLVLRHPS